MKNVIDYNIKGMLGLRLIDPVESDIRVISTQLGLESTPLLSEPDIVIQFHKKIHLEDLKLLGINYAGYTENDFYILGYGKNRVKVKIPFENIGSNLKIECESGLRVIPLLVEIINLTLLNKKYIPVHGSAFKYKDLGVFVCGWENGGKTEILLSFANNGAGYVADDWTVLSADGSTMTGMPMPLYLLEWKFKYMKKKRVPIQKEDKMLFFTIHMINLCYRMVNRGWFKNRFPLTILRDALPLINKLLRVKIHPYEIFGKRFSDWASPDIVLHAITWNNSEIVVTEGTFDDIATRMVESNTYEYATLFEYFRAFRYAFPQRENKFLETCFTQQVLLLNKALKGKKCYQVFHPYPISFDRLYEKIVPHLT